MSCERRKQPGGCDLHNLQCQYPECDREGKGAAERRPQMDTDEATRKALNYMQQQAMLRTGYPFENFKRMLAELGFAVAPVELTEAFKDATVHLIGAASAYERFAGNSKRAGPRDALFSTRNKDFKKAVTRARRVYRKLVKVEK